MCKEAVKHTWESFSTSGVHRWAFVGSHTRSICMSLPFMLASRCSLSGSSFSIWRSPPSTWKHSVRSHVLTHGWVLGSGLFLRGPSAGGGSCLLVTWSLRWLHGCWELCADPHRSARPPSPSTAARRDKTHGSPSTGLLWLSQGSSTIPQSVGTQELGREPGSKVFLVAPQRKAGQMLAITCSTELKGSFSILKASEVICGIQRLQMELCATGRDKSLMALRNRWGKTCTD